MNNSRITFSWPDCILNKSNCIRSCSGLCFGHLFVIFTRSLLSHLSELSSWAVCACNRCCCYFFRQSFLSLVIRAVDLVPSGRASRSVPDFDCAFSEIYSGSVRSFAVFVVPRFCLQKEKQVVLCGCVCVCVRRWTNNPKWKKRGRRK